MTQGIGVVDYLERIDEIPEIIKNILDDFDESGDLYKECERVINMLNDEGWTADFDLGGELFDLKPMSKEERITYLTKKMLDSSIHHMSDFIDRSVKSGLIDVGNWDENHNPMLIPKAILIAALETEAKQYDAKGTSFEKQIKKEVRNLKCL